MKPEFLSDGPALVIEGDERLLVVADLHFGIEADLAVHGLHFKSHSDERLLRLLATIDTADPDRLILLGDVKHSIPSVTRQEFAEMPSILAAIRRRIPFLVFPGNHDIGIERFLREEEIGQKDGAVIDGTGFLHGHMYPAPALAGHLICCGHHHPMACLHDEVGCSLQAPAYIRAGIDTAMLGFPDPAVGGYTSRVLFMPAFNEIAGYDILKIARDPFSPLSRSIKTSEIEIILADGTYIGPLSALEHDESG
ncbi:MAG: metallophosphoesterase [Methanoregula sp.]|nr:metallophosphoesterase [Methanoregula sp.]MDD5025193.1 metallophosphoesterase [Methanoregula sp.]